MEDLTTIEGILDACRAMAPAPGALLRLKRVIFPAIVVLGIDEQDLEAVLFALETAGVASLEELDALWAAHYDSICSVPAPSNGSRAKKGVPERIIQITDQQGVEPIFDQTRSLHVLYNATVSGVAVTKVARANSAEFRAYLTNLVFETEGTIPGADAIGKVLTIFAARAHASGLTYEFHTRVARTADAYWIDMSNPLGEALRVDAAGWKIVSNPDVFFRRYSHQRPQVRPSNGAGVNGLRRILEFMTVKGPDDQLLLLVSLVVGLVGGIAHPIPLFCGGQGGGKSSSCTVFKMILDPSALPTMVMPKSPAELVQQLNHHWCIAYDNLSGLTEEMSDSLCRAVTGAGISKRQLYTDDEDVVYSFKNIVLLNGINNPADKADLLDRTILIRLDRLSPDRRVTDTQFWEGFNAAAPEILGGALDVLSKARAILPGVRLPKLPRLADFAVHGFAVAEAMGVGGEAFLAAYERSIAAQNVEALTSSPVATAILRLVEDPSLFTPDRHGNRVWEGTAASLLQVLNAIASAQGLPVTGRDWPQSERTVRNKVDEAKANLAEAGVLVSNRVSNGSKLITITSVSPAPSDDVAKA